MDYCGPAALTITFVISYFWFFFFLYTPHVRSGVFLFLRFCACILYQQVLVPKSGFPYSILSITSLIFHRILTITLLISHHFGPILKLSLHM